MSKKNALLTVALAALASVTGTAVTAGVANAQSNTAPTPVPPPAPVTVVTAWAGAPRTTEEDRQFKVNGRVQYDFYNIDQDLDVGADTSESGSYARRLFLGVEGRFTQNWRYNVKIDFAPGISGTGAETNEVRVDDGYLEYAGADYSLILGQNNAIAHMEDRTSSNYTPFNERSMIDQAFGFGKIFGVAGLWSGGNWSLGGGYYFDTLNNPQALNTDEQQYAAVRGTWAPIYSRTPEGTTLVHLGLSARHREAQGTPTSVSGLSYSARPAQNSLTGLGATIASSGTFESDDLYGAEAAVQWNAFGATAEYMLVEAQRYGAGADGEATGGYVDLFWSPTGESRNYVASDGSWGRVTPRRTLGSDGGIGHVMISARYEWLDLSDTAFGATRGEQTGYNVGLTWQPISYVKFQLNHGTYETDLDVGVDQEIESTTLRTQFDW